MTIKQISVFLENKSGRLNHVTKVLADAGAEGAVVGLAMYTGVINPWEWDTPWLA